MKILNSASQYVFSIILVEKVRFVRPNWNILFEITYETKLTYMCLYVYMCFVVTWWERADLLALVCGVFCEFVTFPLVSWVRCGT